MNCKSSQTQNKEACQKFLMASFQMEKNVSKKVQYFVQISKNGSREEDEVAGFFVFSHIRMIFLG